MRFFAIVLVPGGNILAQVAAIKKNCSPILGSPEGLALPEGIYLGFFEFPAPALRKKFLRRFDLEAQGLFSGLPERLRFGSVRYMGKSAYLTPFGGLSGDPAENARSIGAKTGLVEYADPPILPESAFLWEMMLPRAPSMPFPFRIWRLCCWSCTPPTPDGITRPGGCCAGRPEEGADRGAAPGRGVGRPRTRSLLSPL